MRLWGLAFSPLTRSDRLAPPAPRIAMLVPTFLYPLLEAVILLYCGFNSFKAIESKGEGTDDTKWLTFWLVYTVTSFAKAILDLVSILIPLYNELNLALIVYLAHVG